VPNSPHLGTLSVLFASSLCSAPVTSLIFAIAIMCPPPSFRPSHSFFHLVWLHYCPTMLLFLAPCLSLSFFHDLSLDDQVFTSSFSSLLLPFLHPKSQTVLLRSRDSFQPCFSDERRDVSTLVPQDFFWPGQRAVLLVDNQRQVSFPSPLSLHPACSSCSPKIC